MNKLDFPLSAPAELGPDASALSAALYEPVPRPSDHCTLRWLSGPSISRSAGLPSATGGWSGGQSRLRKAVKRLLWACRYDGPQVSGCRWHRNQGWSTALGQRTTRWSTQEADHTSCSSCRRSPDEDNGPQSRSVSMVHSAQVANLLQNPPSTESCVKPGPDDMVTGLVQRMCWTVIMHTMSCQWAVYLYAGLRHDLHQAVKLQAAPRPAATQVMYALCG